MKLGPSSGAGEELDWVARARAGDVAAFERLIDLYDKRLLYFVRRFLADGDQALDVLQEVWLVLFRRLGSLRSPEAFRVWLYQIAHDQVITLLRKQQREQTMLAALQHEVEDTDVPEPAVDEAEHVHRALPLLSPEHREVLLLHYLEDMPLQEIAESVRCQLGTVKSRLHYARRQMRQLLEEMKHE